MLIHKSEVPILEKKINDQSIVYLDSAATSQKPQVVIDCLSEFYTQSYANVHRGAYHLSAKATYAFEKARETISQHIGANTDELVLVRGATEAINLVAYSFVQPRVKAGDEIIVTVMEHHSNLVPWLNIQETMGVKIRPVELTSEGLLDEDMFRSFLSDKTKMIAMTHVSNVLGCELPCQRLIKMAHEKGIPVLVDGAQAIPHKRVNVKEMDADFYVFSGHKAYGPTGVGCLYGKKELLENMRPYQTGGSMIVDVSFEKATYLPPPLRFEAGTPAIAETIAFAKAIELLNSIGLDRIEAYEKDLIQYFVQSVQKEFPEIEMFGSVEQSSCLVSFNVQGVHSHDVATILDTEGIAVRAGHHCAMPLMTYFKVPAMLRASVGLYNDRGDIDRLLDGLKKVKEVFV